MSETLAPRWASKRPRCAASTVISRRPRFGHGKKNVTLGIPGTGLSYRTQASSQLVIAAVVVVILVGIAYLIQPELIKAALHWWQPKWF